MPIRLKKGKDKAVLNRHHWIFSGAVADVAAVADGDLTEVVSSSNEMLGWAYVNRKSKILARMISFGEEKPLQSIKRNLSQAISMRKTLIDGDRTNCFRAINGEGDHLPGLVVDKYNDYLVLQISTLGINKLKSQIVERLITLFQPKGIFEKSKAPSRKEEGLPPHEEILYGEIPDEVTVLENGLKYIVDIKKGQKTGMFLDHRMMRQSIQNISKGKKVLNCFSYTGGFSIAAMAGGAMLVDSVDISEHASSLAARNAKLNGFDGKNNSIYTEDVFQFLREKSLDYDIIILDPPAFSKKRNDLIPACRGYKDINRLALKKMPKGTILLTCSCSHHVDEQLFQKVVFQAAAESGREAKIIGKHLLAVDHPINIFHPESSYLKSLMLYVC